MKKQNVPADMIKKALQIITNVAESENFDFTPEDGLLFAKRFNEGEFKDEGDWQRALMHFDADAAADDDEDDDDGGTVGYQASGKKDGDDLVATDGGLEKTGPKDRKGDGKGGRHRDKRKKISGRHGRQDGWHSILEQILNVGGEEVGQSGGEYFRPQILSRKT